MGRLQQRERRQRLFLPLPPAPCLPPSSLSTSDGPSSKDEGGACVAHAGLKEGGGGGSDEEVAGAKRMENDRAAKAAAGEGGDNMESGNAAGGANGGRMVAGAARDAPLVRRCLACAPPPSAFSVPLRRTSTHSLPLPTHPHPPPKMSSSPTSGVLVGGLALLVR